MENKNCLCGCGKETNKGKIFVSGHNTRLNNLGGFKKNHVPWNLNKQHSEKTILKIKKTVKDQYKNGRINPNKGKTVDIDSKNKTSRTLKNYYHSEEGKEKRKEQSLIRKGKRISIQTEFKKGRIPHNKGMKMPCITGEKHYLRNEEKREKWFKIMENIWRSEVFINKKRESRAKQTFPINDTMIEIKFQDELQKRNINFLKHFSIMNIKNKFQCDIFIEPNIVIECDGDYWHNYPHHNEKDIVRTKEMQEKGYTVFRFWEKEIKNNAEGCVDEIEEYLMQTNNRGVYNL